MKTSRTPLLILAVLMLMTAVLLGFEAAHLPETVATHFDGAGQANGWMQRSSHLLFSAVFAFLFPLLPVGVSIAVNRLPTQFINIPRRDFWLAPERRKETGRWLVRHSLWLGCLLGVLQFILQGLIFAANQAIPPHLPTQPVMLLLGGFLAGLAVWMLILWRRFSIQPN